MLIVFVVSDAALVLLPPDAGSDTSAQAIHASGRGWRVIWIQILPKINKKPITIGEKTVWRGSRSEELSFPLSSDFHMLLTDGVTDYLAGLLKNSRGFLATWRKNNDKERETSKLGRGKINYLTTVFCPTRQSLAAAEIKHRCLKLRQQPLKKAK